MLKLCFSNIVITTCQGSLAKVAQSIQGKNTVQLQTVQFTYLVSIIKVSIKRVRDSQVLLNITKL